MKLSIKERIDLTESYIRDVRKHTEVIEQDLQRMKDERQKADITLTNRQAGRLLGVTEQTIIRMKNDGRLKSTKFLEVYNYSKS